MMLSSDGRSKSIAAGVVLALLAASFTPTPAMAATGTTTRVSVASDGTQASGGISTSAAVSADGRYVAFESRGPNLVARDTNGAADVFVHDRWEHTTTRVSTASDGTQGNGSSVDPAISADGRFVAFQSDAFNLVPDDTNNRTDVFVHDRQTGSTSRVSLSSLPLQEAGGPSTDPALSTDGSYVAFTSSAANLVAGDVNNMDDVFVHDRQTSTTSRVSVASDGTQGTAPHRRAAMSADGRHVSFESGSSNLVAGDTNNAGDTFVHDRETATTSRVSVASDGTQANGSSGEAAISADGRHVSFFSFASNLVTGDTNVTGDIFVHDRQTATTSRVSVASDGTQGGASSSIPDIDAAGRHVTFQSSAANLVPGDTNGRVDIFVHDRQTATTSRVSVASDGTQADAISLRPDISADGRYVAFNSEAGNLVPGDTNGNWDAFVHDRQARVPMVSAGDAAVHEGDNGTRTAAFTVSLSEPAEAAVTVAYATADDSATAPADYTTKAGTLTFPRGVTSQIVKVPVPGDRLEEGDQIFTVTLSSAAGATIGDGVGVGTIYDDDPGTGRRLAIGDVAVHEGDSGNRAAVFNVSMSKASTAYVTVNFATVKGTAVGTDFTGKSGTLTFAPGSTSATVKVAITPDTAAEGNEVFTVKLSSSNGPTISDATGVGTIIDND